MGIMKNKPLIIVAIIAICFVMFMLLKKENGPPTPSGDNRHEPNLAGLAQKPSVDAKTANSSRPPTQSDPNWEPVLISKSESKAYLQRVKLRPDVQEFIDRTYSTPDERAAMTQFALAQQSAIDIGGTKEGAIRAHRFLRRALACVRTQFGDKYDVEAKRVLAITINTDSQFSAFSLSEDNLQGQSYIDPQDQHPCDN
jgi:hypothetical protein